MSDESDNVLNVMAALRLPLRKRHSLYLRMKRAWRRTGFSGVEALARTESGKSMCEPGMLASGVKVISLRCGVGGRTSLVRWMSDGRCFVFPLKLSFTANCDVAYECGGYDAVKRIYASDIFARGESKLIMCESDDGDEVLALADVIGTKLVCTFYARNAGRTQVRA